MEGDKFQMVTDDGLVGCQVPLPVIYIDKAGVADIVSRDGRKEVLGFNSELVPTPVHSRVGRS